MKLSIVTRIVLLFSAVIFIFAGVSYYQLTQMRQSTALLSEMNSGYLPLLKIIARIDSNLGNQSKNVAKLYEDKGGESSLALLRMILEYSPNSLKQTVSSGVAHCDKMLLSVSYPDRVKFFSEMRADLLALLQKAEEYQKRARDLSQVLQRSSGDPVSAFNELGDAGQSLDRSVKLLSLKMEEELAQSMIDLSEEGDRSTWAGIFMTISALVAALILTLISILWLKPIRRLIAAAREIGSGDYRNPVTIRSGGEIDELAREFETMRLALLQHNNTMTDQARKLELSNVELKSLKAHYENILKSIRMPVLVADVYLRLRTYNPEAKRLWGEDLDRRLGESIGELPLQDGRLEEAMPLKSVLEGHRLFSEAPLCVVNPKGEPRQYHVMLVPFWEGERINGLLLLGEDVTERRQIEEKMLRSERLAAAGRIAQRITHEIRNPLSSIRLNAEVLQDELSSEPFDSSAAKPLLHSIVREVERLQIITEDYLALARKPMLKRKRVDLNDFLAEIGAFYRAELDRRSLTCEMRLEPAPLVTNVDETRLARVLHNLIKNSMEALPPNGRIILATERTEARAILHIMDDGPGVPAGNEAAIFEPFFSTKEGGTGLGLTLAHQIVQDQGGQLSYRTRPEGGAHFSIRLPWPGEEEPDFESASAAEEETHDIGS